MLDQVLSLSGEVSKWDVKVSEMRRTACRYITSPQSLIALGVDEIQPSEIVSLT